MLIRKKLPIIILLLVALPLFLLGSAYYSYISKQLVNENKEKMVQVLNMESEYLKTFFYTRSLEVHYLAKSQNVLELINTFWTSPNNNSPDFRMDSNDLNQKFAALNEQRDDLRDVFILSPYGRIIASSNPESMWIDLSERKYFSDAMLGKTTISNLIRNKVDGDSVLFVATPIYDETESKVLGVMANIIDMNNTSDGIRNLIDPKVGNAYLIDDTGTIIFHTDKSLIGTTPKNKDVNAYFTQNTNLKMSGSEIFNSTNGKLFVIYKGINETNWKLVIEQDLNVVMSSAYRALYVIILLSVFILICATIFSIRFARTLTKPLTELTNVMNETTKGNLSIRSEYQNTNELGQLSKNLNSMLDELTGTYEELTEKNEELIAAEEELRVNYEALNESQQEVKTTQERYALALQSARDVIWEWNLVDQTFFASEHWSHLTGKETYQSVIHKVAFEELLSSSALVQMAQQMQALITKQIEWLEFDFEYLTPTEEMKWFKVKASAYYDTWGTPLKISGVLVDITYPKKAEARIWNLAFEDQLTKLPNRTAFMAKLEEELGKRNIIQSRLGLLLLDIDNFKRINDTLGHNIGDQLLVEVANRLKNLGYPIYRLSGDEFGFIFTEIWEEEPLIQETKQILNAFVAPILLQCKTINMTVSIGGSIFPMDGKSSEKLVQNADTAMYSAKDLGKSQVVFFTKVMADRISQKVEIEEMLRRSIKDQLISMHFQPQYGVQSNELIGFEALMRMTLEEGNMISPMAFIPVAEETGLIIELGEWAIQHVVEKIRDWLDKGYVFGHISVNVSGVQLKQPDFAQLVHKIVSEAGVDPGYLELEITESILVDNLERNIQTLTRLREMGFMIALDDFGTGYSSFNYLRTIPLTCLKIDKSFIDYIGSSKKAEALVRQIIEIAREIDLKVVAEGVESQDQYEILAKTPCDLIQGYFYSKPLPLEKAEALFLK